LGRVCPLPGAHTTTPAGLPRLWPRRGASFPFGIQTSHSPGLLGLFVAAGSSVGCSQGPGVLQKQPGPHDQNPFCHSSLVWVEFDHLLDMFVRWKRAFCLRALFLCAEEAQISCLPFLSPYFITCGTWHLRMVGPIRKAVSSLTKQDTGWRTGDRGLLYFQALIPQCLVFKFFPLCSSSCSVSGLFIMARKREVTLILVGLFNLVFPRGAATFWTWILLTKHLLGVQCPVESSAPWCAFRLKIKVDVVQGSRGSHGDGCACACARVFVFSTLSLTRLLSVRPSRLWFIGCFLRQ